MKTTMKRIIFVFKDDYFKVIKEFPILIVVNSLELDRLRKQEPGIFIKDPQSEPSPVKKEDIVMAIDYHKDFLPSSDIAKKKHYSKFKSIVCEKGWYEDMMRLTGEENSTIYIIYYDYPFIFKSNIVNELRELGNICHDPKLIDTNYIKTYFIDVLNYFLKEHSIHELYVHQEVDVKWNFLDTSPSNALIKHIDDSYKNVMAPNLHNYSNLSTRSKSDFRGQLIKIVTKYESFDYFGDTSAKRKRIVILINDESKKIIIVPDYFQYDDKNKLFKRIVELDDLLENIKENKLIINSSVFTHILRSSFYKLHDIFPSFSGKQLHIFPLRYIVSPLLQAIVNDKCSVHTRICV